MGVQAYVLALRGATQDDAPAPYTDVSESARWRALRKTFEQICIEMVKNGMKISPLFGAPGFDHSVIVIGALHALDLGVAQEVAGNVFFESIATTGVCPGRSREERLKGLWVMIKKHYSEMNTPTRLQKLTPQMIKHNDK